MSPLLASIGSRVFIAEQLERRRLEIGDQLACVAPIRLIGLRPDTTPLLQLMAFDGPGEQPPSVSSDPDASLPSFPAQRRQCRVVQCQIEPCHDTYSSTCRWRFRHA